MSGTAFPTRPCDVARLTVSEFTCELDLDATVSFDRVCGRFLDDANRALVWFIRFHALTAWRERGDMATWLDANPSRVADACEVAASFELNHDWEFDAETFRSAVESVVRQVR
ncbi:MAG TPA: hypothetical protein VNA65_08000 [Candidatus Dormibacteraeota bacterium]|nr:hypothetical protein [Candidatus Dormibacteraeota bacterium]